MKDLALMEVNGLDSISRGNDLRQITTILGSINGSAGPYVATSYPVRDYSSTAHGHRSDLYEQFVANLFNS